MWRGQESGESGESGGTTNIEGSSPQHSATSPSPREGHSVTGGIQYWDSLLQEVCMMIYDLDHS